MFRHEQDVYSHSCFLKTASGAQQNMYFIFMTMWKGLSSGSFEFSLIDLLALAQVRATILQTPQINNSFILLGALFVLVPEKN